MGWTATTFKARWGEFAPTDDALVAAALAEADAECDARVFGGSYDHAVGLLAAHKLSVSAFGLQARLDPKAAKDTPNGTTTYGQEHDAIAAKKAGGFWALGVRL
jgi:hypothetical protein